MKTNALTDNQKRRIRRLVDDTHGLHMQIRDLSERRQELMEQRGRKREELRRAEGHSFKYNDEREAALKPVVAQLELLERQVAELNDRMEALVAQHQPRRKLANAIFAYLDEVSPRIGPRWGSGDVDDQRARLL